jgi:hypothetical protein
MSEAQIRFITNLVNSGVGLNVLCLMVVERVNRGEDFAFAVAQELARNFEKAAKN